MRKLSSQGRAGRKHLLRKIPVECIENGCHATVFVNLGNATKGVRCPYHRRLRRNDRARKTHKRNRDERRGRDYDLELDNRLTQLRSFVTLVKCRNDFCDELVEVDGLTARQQKGVYCERCRREAKRIDDRNYYARRGRRQRMQRRHSAKIAA